MNSTYGGTPTICQLEQTDKNTTVTDNISK